MTSMFKQSVVDMGNTFGVLTYDIKQKSLVPELCDYAQELIDGLALSRLTVEKELGHLKVFWAYLATNRLKLEEVSDNVLVAFRDAAFLEAKASPSHRGGRDAPKRTVNAKLVRVYDWLFWLRETSQISKKVIGSNGQVRSTLRGSSISGIEPMSRRYRKSRSAYPTLFRLETGRSKHNVPHSIPSEGTVDKLHEHFFERASSDFLAHRNVLLVDIANCTGFRRASIQSLRVEQFVGSDYENTNRDTVILKPARQKFGYENTFEVPAYIHVQAQAFIRDHWLPFVREKGFSQGRHGGNVFISARNGAPLDERSITSIFSKALRTQGFKKGVAVHAFRVKFTGDEVAEEFASRNKLNLDTSADSVKWAVATKLGHRNPDSLHPYTSKYESTEVARRRSADYRERDHDKKKIAELEAEIEELKRQR